MITLITGSPGAGKTLLAVGEFLKEAEAQGRTIVVDAIPDLAIEHEPAPPVSEWTKQVEDASSQEGKKLLFNFQQGALVVIDEAQRVYRPRPVGSKVPPEVAAFETHRHQGLDFILLTQHPNLIDSNVRKLVGRHIHIRDLGVLGRKIYEWPEVGNPDQFRGAPIQRGYKMRKGAFSLYKSASLHVKPKRGIPKGFLALALCVPLLGFLVWKGYNSVASKVAVPLPVASAPTIAHPMPGREPDNLSLDRTSMFLEYTPRVPGRPETAPAYDALRVVKNMPVVAGCVQTAARCTCQTQSGTDAGLDRLQCLAWLQNPPFDAYREAPVQLGGDGRDRARDATGAAIASGSTNPNEQPKSGNARNSAIIPGAV